eukprot:TRINITY_DN11300_c0_g1_i1.p1 TRINITY_DN11300_c0_g1~~TRINITY_DN11300_c0_g1_i1.p1  ORF type:complete len:275 (-),score=57.49 TRINITY_DN11300_c0_g1_i1:61-819(-)
MATVVATQVAMDPEQNKLVNKFMKTHNLDNGLTMQDAKDYVNVLRKFHPSHGSPTYLRKSDLPKKEKKPISDMLKDMKEKFAMPERPFVGLDQNENEISESPFYKRGPMMTNAQARTAASIFKSMGYQGGEEPTVLEGVDLASINSDEASRLFRNLRAKLPSQTTRKSETPEKKQIDRNSPEMQQYYKALKEKYINGVYASPDVDREALLAKLPKKVDAGSMDAKLKNILLHKHRIEPTNLESQEKSETPAK